MTTKASKNLRNLDITVLFRIRGLKDSDEIFKKKPIALKACLSKATFSVHEDSDFSEDSPRDKEMGLFVRRYNLYTQKNGLKHSNKNLINFRMAKLKRENLQRNKKF